MLVAQKQDRAGLYRDLLYPSKLRRLQPREIVLHASRFAQAEPEFIARYGDTLQHVSVAVFASLSSQHLCSILRLFLYAEGFAPVITASEFDGIRTDGLNPGAPIWRTDPQVLLILPSLDDIKTWPRMFASESEIKDWVQAQVQLFAGMWETAERLAPRARIFQALFVPPIERPLGNLERVYPFSRTRCVQALNEYIVENCPAAVIPVDFDHLASVVGRENWVDEPAYFLTKQPLSLRQMPVACAYLSRLVACAFGRVRKCLLLDLDGTLWGGVVGDDGVAGLRIDPTDPVGEAHLHFQRYLKLLKERGVLLAVCSKNDETIALAPFLESPDMVLRLDDFASFRANWDDKATNVRRIAQDLNIGLDALVFFDDNPAERAIIEQFEPAVMVIHPPADPALFVRALEESFAFEWPQLTAEDLERSDTYIQDRRRTDLQARFTDYDAYLQSLEMTARIERTGGDALTRVAQLIGKTNQFNVRTQRYSEKALIEMGSAGDYELFHVRFTDRFSNYGIMASVIVRFVADAAFIENWVMSCRVFQRGLENATLNAVRELARGRGMRWLVGEIIPTAKNVYVAELYDRLRFEPWDGSLPGITPAGRWYRLDLDAGEALPHHIQVENDLAQTSDRRVDAAST